MTSPAEVKARLDAERRGEPFLLYRDGGGAQVIVALDRRRSTRRPARRARRRARLGHRGLAPARAARAGRAATGSWSTTGSRATAPTSTASASTAAGGCATATGSCFGETPVDVPRARRTPRPTSTAAITRRRVGRRRSARRQRKVLVALCRPLQGLGLRGARHQPGRSPTRSTSPSTPSRRTCGCSSSASGSTRCRRTRSARGWPPSALVNGVVTPARILSQWTDVPRLWRDSTARLARAFRSVQIARGEGCHLGDGARGSIQTEGLPMVGRSR